MNCHTTTHNLYIINTHTLVFGYRLSSLMKKITKNYDNSIKSDDFPGTDKVSDDELDDNESNNVTEDSDNIENDIAELNNTGHIQVKKTKKAVKSHHGSLKTNHILSEQSEKKTNFIRLKNIKIAKGRMIVSSADFNINNVIIKKCNRITTPDGKEITFYEATYQYNQTYTSENSNVLDTSLNIPLCVNIRDMIVTRGSYVSTRSMRMPYDSYDDSYAIYENIATAIKHRFLDTILHDYEDVCTQDDINRLKEMKIEPMMIMHKDRILLGKLTKLGSRKENHVNTDIPTIDAFIELVNSRRYNRHDDGWFLKSNVNVVFRCSVSLNKHNNINNNDRENERRFWISFNPVVDMAEFYCNKATYESTMETKKHVVVMNSTIVL
jgi:hypothetical protein